MTTIVGVSGSLRESSFNAGLLRAASEAAPQGCEVTIVSIKEIPLYNGDIEENEGIPQPLLAPRLALCRVSTADLVRRLTSSAKRLTAFTSLT